MDKLHTTMVNTCDRLLRLLTGPQALQDPVAANAALQAIELLQVLESRLRGATGKEGIASDGFEHFLHDDRVSDYVAEVFGVLREEGYRCPEIVLVRH